MLKLKRIYAPAEPSDGFRVLVDRLWPRGVSKEKARVGLWMKEIAPSGALRKWFGHDPRRWSEFRKRYDAELRQKTALVAELKQLEKRHGTITLVYSAHDELHNQALALQAYLHRRTQW